MTRTDNDIWKPEEYAAYHKMVFRIAFDFLNDHFPPQDDPKWWEQFSIDTSAASSKSKGGPLVDGILLAIGNYLEQENIKRRDRNG